MKLIEGEKQLVDGQNELEKQKEQFLSGEIKLQSAKVELDNAKQEFLNQGIDPTKSTQEYDKQIDSLNILITTYDSLSKDIKETTSNLKEGDKIPNEKIQYWKGIISNPSLGLNGLSDLVNGLEQNPENISLALNISKAVEDANKTLSENKSKLEILVSGIIKYQQGVTVYEEQVNIFNEGKIKLEEAEKQLDNGKEEIIKGKADLEEGKKQGQLELDKAKKELEDSEQKLLDGEKEIKENREKLIDGRKEIDKEKEKLNDLDDSKYYFFGRG